MSFWLFSWDLVKEEVIGFFREFHDLGRFGKNHNAMFSVLIPKKRRRGAVDDLTDFGPISLVGGLYKLIANFFGGLRMWYPNPRLLPSREDKF